MGKEKFRNKQGCLTATYRLGKFEWLNQEEVKVLVNRSVRNLAPIRIYDKRKTVLEVKENGWTPLCAYQGSYLTDYAIMTFLKYTMQTAYDCERYGLRVDNLCWDFDKVFVDLKGKVRMVYWPVTTLEQNSKSALEFYRAFCVPIQNSRGLSAEIKYSYCSYFYQRGHLDFAVFRQLLLELIEKWQCDMRERKDIRTQQPPKPQNPPSVSIAWLERMDTGEHYELLDKSIRIGRDSKRCQIVIRGNIEVGRFHALIEQENGRYYLTDQGSVNGTKVDGIRLEKGQRWLLTDRMQLRFARVSFLFREEQTSGTVPIHIRKRC